MIDRHLNFHGFDSTAWTLFCVGAVVAALVMMVMLLRYERRLVPRKVGLALLGLRVLVLAALLLTLAEPTVSWTIDRDQAGRILVAVDLSESMNTTDAHATKAEKLRWARALGMIGNTAIDARLDRWIKAYEEGREPELVDENETNDPERRRQLAEIRREELDRIFQDLEEISRKELALKLLTQTSRPLLPALREVGNVELAVFAGRAEAADEATLPGLIKETPRSVLPGISDLTQALTSGGATTETSPLMGIVLLTDGRDNGGRQPLAAAQQLGQMQVKVCPVLIGSTNRPKDLSVAELDYPKKVLQGDHPVLKATLITTGFENQELTVVMQNKEGEPETRTVTPHGPTTLVEFDLEGDDLGRHEYDLRIEPLEGETRDDNNAQAFALQVVDDKVRVQIVEGEARWEFRYLDNVFARDERVESDRAVFRQPYMGVLPETFFPRTLDMPADGDLEKSPFAEADLVIIGDIAPDECPESAWLLLEKFVAEAGGTLVLTAGKQHFPRDFQSPTLKRLMPMAALRAVDMNGFADAASPTERGFRLRLTPDGERAAMFQFEADPIANRAVWAGLPGHLWGLLGEPKPGATVFAYAETRQPPPGGFPERENAVIVQQHYGFGQVLWIGIDSTWRWRYRVGDKYHHRFWGQMGRWAADNKAAAGNEFVKFGPERSDIEVGQDAVLRARFTQQFLAGHRDVQAKAELFRVGDEPGEPFTTVPLKVVEGKPLLREGRAVSLPSGVYQVKLVLDGIDFDADEIATSLYVQEKHTLELSDLSAHRELLAQMAQASGGRLFYPDELDELPAQFARPEQVASLRHEEQLWDRWYTMLLFFALLTGEWFVRKFNGLP